MLLVSGVHFLVLRLGVVDLLGKLQGREEDAAANTDPDDSWLPALRHRVRQGLWRERGE